MSDPEVSFQQLHVIVGPPLHRRDHAEGMMPLGRPCMCAVGQTEHTWAPMLAAQCLHELNATLKNNIC